MRRLASTLLFGLACSVITALHISSQRLPDTGEAGRRGRDHGGDCSDRSPAIGPAAASDGENREGPPAVAADQQPAPAQLPGVRLHQRGMAWAVDDTSSSDAANSPRQPPLGKSSSSADEAPANLTARPPDPRRVPPRAPVREPPRQPPRALGNGPATLQVGFPGRSSAAPTELKDIFIGVKTTGAYHKSRVQLILDTWLPQAQAQVSEFNFFSNLSFCFLFFSSSEISIFTSQVRAPLFSPKFRGLHLNVVPPCYSRLLDHTLTLVLLQIPFEYLWLFANRMG